MARQLCRQGRWARACQSVDRTRHVQNAAETQQTELGQVAQKVNAAIKAIRESGEIASAGLLNGGVSSIVHFKKASVTDADLKPLKDIDVAESEISGVYIGRTKVSDAGIEYIKVLHHLSWLTFDGTQITDAGLDALKELDQLKDLRLIGTKVTAAGVKKLQKDLPNCKIEWTSPTKDERQSPAAPDQLRWPSTSEASHAVRKHSVSHAPGGTPGLCRRRACAILVVG